MAGAAGAGALLLLLLLVAVAGRASTPVDVEVKDCYWFDDGTPGADLSIENDSGRTQDVFVKVSFESDGEQVADGLETMTVAADTTAATDVSAISVAGTPDYSEPPTCKITDVTSYED